ncbi:MAG: hypothetical protein HYR51_19540 [Candidatus Rokubacteria bacterium]|nr:hypothetical protein [Candidatus Rokubacteria bacterium]
MAVNAAGAAAFAWTTGTTSPIRARVQSADGTLEPVQSVWRGDGNVRTWDVALDADGGAVFAWAFSRYRPASSDYIDVAQTRTRAPTGELTPVQTVARADLIAVVRVAAGAAGNAVFVWSESPGLAARRRSADGTLGPVDRLSENGSQAAVAGNVEGVVAVLGWESPLVGFIGP